MRFFAMAMGLIGVLVSAYTVTAINQWVGLQIHSMGLLFVIPVGGVILGILGSGGFVLGKLITQSKASGIDFLYSGVLGLLTFVGVNYLSYTNIYVAPSLEGKIQIEQQFAARPGFVSLDELMSFGDYLVMVQSSSKLQIRTKGGTTKEDAFEVGAVGTTAMFYLQFLGALFGGLGALLLLADRKYCNQCKRYQRVQKLRSIDLEHWDRFAVVLQDNYHDGSSLKTAIQMFDAPKIKSDQFFQVVFEYCPEFHAPQLLILFFARNSAGEYKEVKEMCKTLPLSPECAQALSRDE